MFLSILTTLLLINLSAVLFYTKIEGWSVLNAIYFSWVTLIPSSINIGFSPTTSLGKIFTMMYLVVGVGLMIGLLSIVAKAILKFDEKEKLTIPTEFVRRKRKAKNMNLTKKK